jgi:hypothetical protein
MSTPATKKGVVTMEIGLIETWVSQERRIPAKRPPTIELLVEQLFVVQRISRWLSLETHGDAYVRVRELNELIHQAQRKLRDIQNGTNEANKRFVLEAADQALQQLTQRMHSGRGEKAGH